METSFKLPPARMAAPLIRSSMSLTLTHAWGKLKCSSRRWLAVAMTGPGNTSASNGVVCWDRCASQDTIKLSNAGIGGHHLAVFSSHGPACQRTSSCRDLRSSAPPAHRNARKLAILCAAVGPSPTASFTERSPRIKRNRSDRRLRLIELRLRRSATGRSSITRRMASSFRLVKFVVLVLPSIWICPVLQRCYMRLHVPLLTSIYKCG